MPGYIEENICIKDIYLIYRKYEIKELTETPEAFMFGKAHAIDFRNNPAAPGAAPGVGLRSMECLWVRLKAGDRIRPRDAQLLKRLAVAPFDQCGIYELNSCGYVVAVGLPDSSERLDAEALLSCFEARYGIPVSFSKAIHDDACKSYGT